jgi:hypothetical protein
MYPTRKVITLIFYFGLLAQYCMKYIILKYLLPKPIQHIVEKKDSVQTKALAWKDVGIFRKILQCTLL